MENFAVVYANARPTTPLQENRRDAYSTVKQLEFDFKRAKGKEKWKTVWSLSLQVALSCWGIIQTTTKAWC